MPNNKDVIRERISILTSFLISLLLVVFALILTVQTTFLDLSYLRNKITSSDYALNLSNEIKEYFVSYSMASGFEEEDITSILDGNTVVADVMVKAMKLYNPGVTDINIDTFKQHLYDNLKASLEEKNYTIDAEVENSLNYLVDVCAKTYEEQVNFPFSSMISSLITDLSFMPLLLIAVFLIILFFMTFLLMINKSISKRLMYCVYSLFGAAFTVIIPILIFMPFNKINNIGIISKALHNLVASYCNGILHVIILIGGVYIVLGVIALAAYYHRRKRHRKQHQYNAINMNAQIYDYEKNI